MKETYEDGSTVSYAYDNTGALATVTDSATGITTTYYYDLINRLVKYEEKGTNRSHSVTYIYDEKNNLSSYTEVIDGVSTTYAYTYDDDNRVTSMTVGNTTVTYTYDDFGRMSQQVTKHGDTVVLTENATFKDPSDTASSGQITSYNGFNYTYDANGNILSVSDGTNTTTYEYDSLNQLIRENNQARNKTQTWTYDNAGNIQNRTEYAYTTAADLTGATPTKTVTYSYGNSNWGDLLTGYDGKTFTYDEIGNLTSDGTYTYTWKHGRQLASTTQGSTVWNYTYDSNGMRTKQASSQSYYAYEYTYSGSQLIKMTVMQKEYLFTYDANGVPLTVTYEGTTYYYSTNLQGDVVAILDSAGEIVETYTYDAWGNHVHSYNGPDLFTFLHYQPLRYRGYVYDVETGLYYLQSRYYNPQTGRFINGDGLVQTGQGFVGNNMFAYCLNNPVIFADDAGTAAHLVTIEFFDDGGGGGEEDDDDDELERLKNILLNEIAKEGHYYVNDIKDIYSESNPNFHFQITKEDVAHYTYQIQAGDYGEQAALVSAALIGVPDWLSLVINILQLPNPQDAIIYDPSGRIFYLAEGYSVVTITRTYIGDSYCATEVEYIFFDRNNTICFHDTLGKSRVSD